MSHYLKTTREVYKEAALKPDVGLCCTTSPIWQLPGLNIPKKMLEMNYGCGSTVHPRDLAHHPRVLYVGVGGGMELLQFAWFTRKPNSVIGIDPVEEMLEACEKNLAKAKEENEWFSPDFVSLLRGDALQLPVEDETIDVAAQNCLFNIFEPEDLKTALSEMYRVLRPHGRLILSDPICESPIPEHLRQDEKLRALCLSGALPLADYLNMIAEIGFGTIEVRARRPYRILAAPHYDLPQPLFIESVEICAIKDPMPEDGPCVFTGKAAIYYGTETQFDDGKGHVLLPNQPLAICDKTAAALEKLNRQDLYITPSTWFYDGGGCC